LERHCQATNARGEACRQRPFADGELCFWHDPDHAEEAARARQAGGANHRREQTLQAVYDLWGFETVEDARQITRIATLGLLALENTVARNRTLIAAATVVAKLFEVADLAHRLAAVESVLGPKLQKKEPKTRGWSR
jgi:hypothetical protein